MGDDGPGSDGPGSDGPGDGGTEGLNELIGLTVRDVRRHLGLDQRALARRAGVSQSTVARLEAGGDARLSVVAACLAVGGLELVVVARDGLPWRRYPDASDRARDTGGRRLPAHLVARQGRLPTYTVTRRMIAGTWRLRPGRENWLYERRRASDADGSPDPERDVSGTR